jgi:NAD-dependent DNA ligase
MVEKRGGIIKSGVSKDLDILVQKDPTSVSNKTKKAESYGVKIIGIECLKECLNGIRDFNEVLGRVPVGE